MEVDGDDLAHDILSQSVLEDDFEIAEPEEREKILAAVKVLASGSVPAASVAKVSTDSSSAAKEHDSPKFTAFLMEQPSVPLSAIEDSPIPSASNSLQPTPAKSTTLSPVTETASNPPFTTSISEIKSMASSSESDALPSSSVPQDDVKNVAPEGLESDDVKKGALEIKAALAALWYDSYQPFVSKDVFTDRYSQSAHMYRL